MPEPRADILWTFVYPGDKSATQLRRPAFASDGTVVLAASSSPGNSSVFALAPGSGTIAG